MFYGCHSIKAIIFSESFNTSNVESMYSMFAYCRSLISLNLSSFDTIKVTDMGYMFYECKNLTYLDMSHFSPLNITAINRMFKYIFFNLFEFKFFRNK